MDAKTYQIDVLQPALARDELPDEFSRYGLSFSTVNIAGKEVDEAIKVTKAIWTGLANNPKYGSIVRTLMDQAARVEADLRDEGARKRLGREVQVRRFKVLDDWIKVRGQDGGGVMRADAVATLVSQFEPWRISAAEIRDRLRQLNVRVEAPRTAPPPNNIPSWRSPPSQLRDIVLQREVIRGSLVSLGQSGVGAFLGLSATPTREEIAGRRTTAEGHWSRQPNDTRKAAAARLLAILRTQFRDDPGIYRLFAECEGERTLRPFVEGAAADGTISLPEQAQLAKQAHEAGLAAAWMERLIRQIAEERGAKIEPRPSTERSKPSPKSAPANQQPAPAPEPAPKKHQGIWNRLRQWERRNWWPLLLVFVAAKFITSSAADGHPTPQAPQLGPVNVETPKAPTTGVPAAAPAPSVPPEAPPGPTAQAPSRAPAAPAPSLPPPAGAPAGAPAIVADRSRAEAANLRGSRLNDRGRFELAAAAFQEATQADPSYAQAWANLSWAQYRTGRMDDAEASASRAIRLAGGDTQALTTALYTSGRVAEAAGQHDQARAAYARILAIDPSNKLAQSASATLDLYLSPPPALLAAADKVLRGEILEDDDVASMTEDELRIVRNAPYARHGKDFHEPGLNAFYYGPEARVAPGPTIDQGFKPAVLTTGDKANIQFFKALRTSLERAEMETGDNIQEPAASPSTATTITEARPNRSTHQSTEKTAPPTTHNNTTGTSWKDPFAD